MPLYYLSMFATFTNVYYVFGEKELDFKGVCLSIAAHWMESLMQHKPCQE